MKNKYVLLIKTLQLLSYPAPSIAAERVIRLISRPQRIPRPPSEEDWFLNCESFKHQGIQMYRWGDINKPAILLLHGWNGRGTQLGGIAQRLSKDFCIYACDAPGHGYSEGNKLNLRIYIELVKDLAKSYGEFHAIIAHSFGVGAATASHFEGVQCRFLVLIAGPNSYYKVLQNSIRIFNLSHRSIQKIYQLFEKTLGYAPDQLFVGKIGRQTQVKALVVHDRDDKEVPLERAHEIKEQWPEVEVFITENLGHRRILRDSQVLEKISNFILQK